MIGGQIKVLRVGRHMTQEALAKKLNITNQAVSKWEQEVTSPDISLLPEIAEIFGTSIDALYGRTTRTAPACESRREELLTIFEMSASEEDFIRAAEAYRVVFADGKPSPDDYSDYAFLHERRIRADIEIAIRYYKKAIDVGDALRDANWVHANTQYIHMLADVGKADKGVEHARMFHQREPENPHANLFLAYALNTSGDNDAALVAIRHAVAFGADVNILTVAGDICRALGRFDEAFSYWNKAFKLDSSYCTCLYSKAEAYEALGEINQAIEEYQGILKWNERQGFTGEAENRLANERLGALRVSLM